MNLLRKKVNIIFFYVYDSESDTTIAVPAENLDIEDEQGLEFIYDDKVRKVWNAKEEEWYFSIIDIIELLTESSSPKKYWSKLKRQLTVENFETSTISRRFKLKAVDGKMRLTDCFNTEQLLRIIQSIPSKKAEPFKQWLAKVGAERLDEIADPELAIKRAVQTYRQKGYSEKWIEERLHCIDIRKQLTAEWNRAGVKASHDYATLTNILTKAWSGKSIQEYKQFKGLKKENLRDNMTDIELTLNRLAELSSTAIAKVRNPKGFSQTENTVIEGGSIAGNARKQLEASIGESVISPLNALTPNLLETKDNE